MGPGTGGRARGPWSSLTKQGDPRISRVPGPMVVSAEAASPGVGKETTECHAPEAARESATWWSSTGTSSAAKWATRAATVTVGGRPVTKSADGRGRDDEEEEEEEEEAREGGEVLPPVV